MTARKRDDDSTAGDRLVSLEARLVSLRASVEARATPLPPEPRLASGASPAAIAQPRDTNEIESLALLAFNAVNGDPVMVRRFVDALDRLATKKSAK